MVRQSLTLLIAGALTLPCFDTGAVAADASKAAASATTGAVPGWPVTTSLKTTLRNWAQRESWPSPQFLTDADWPVEVPGSIPGSIETALKVLAEGFGRAASRPRIEISANHVIVVSEIGAE
jgi:hypothetical protein